MIRLTSVLAGLVVGAALAPASAQDLIPVTSIKYAGRYDLATQTFYPSEVDPDLSPGDSGTDILYDNTTTNGFLSTGAGGAIATNHHMDWGTPDFGGGGATITEVRIAWATNLAAPNNVGLRFRIYQGATGNGVQGTVVGDYLLTNLPTSATAPLYEGYTLDVTLPAPLVLADGPLGWSYNADNPVGASTSSSGPLTIGPPNAAGAGAAHPLPATGFGSYDRYSEATNAYVSTLIGTGPPSAPMLSFALRLKGRASNPPILAFENYGTGNGPTVTGEGSATPGSVDNVLHLHANPPGKNVILVAGVTQSDFLQPSLGLNFYAFPWVLQLAPIPTPLLDGNVDLAAPFDAGLQPGDEFFIQIFSQNLANQYKKYSPGLKIIVQ